MSLGIYVDRWRLGTHSEKEVDDLLSFCDAANISDIYLHCHEDRAVNNNWDYVGYALSKAKQNIHLWLSMTLGRENPQTLQKAQDLKKPTDGGKFYTKIEGELGTVLALNPKSKSAKEYFITKIKNLVAAYPKVYGFHIDKTNHLADELMLDVRKETKGKYLSITHKYGDDYFNTWQADEFVPMFSGGYVDISNIDFTGVNSIALSLFGCNLAKSKERIALLKKQGIIPLLYSYGAFSNNPKETRAEFLGILNV